MTLLQHLQNINANSKEKMAQTPGLWIGMITEDLDHWAGYGVHTPEQLDRYFLEVDVYEMHKEAYGVKGRHYNFDKMTDQELKDEFESLAKIAEQERKEEEKQQAKAVADFEETITETIELGAGGRETAIKWILEGEGLDNEYDPSYICYCLNLPYHMGDIFKPFTKEVH